MLNPDFSDMLSCLRDEKVEPSRIDLMTNIDGVEFDEAWKRRTGVTIDNLEIDVLSEKDLIKNKLATGRKQDKLDALSLRNRNTPHN